MVNQATKATVESVIASAIHQMQDFKIEVVDMDGVEEVLTAHGFEWHGHDGIIAVRVCSPASCQTVTFVGV